MKTAKVAGVAWGSAALLKAAADERGLGLQGGESYL